MRAPQRPPKMTGRFEAMVDVPGPTYRGEYIHWDKLRRLKPPETLSKEQWWFALKMHRRALLKPCPLLDQAGTCFWYGLPDSSVKMLHEMDKGMAREIMMPDEVVDTDSRDRYVVNSLIEESFRSSQLEGAVTTRAAAREMTRSGRKPRDKSEQMVMNNYRAMGEIRELKGESMTPEIVFELHRIVTENTLDDPAQAGCFRRDEDHIHVADMYGEVFHVPPPADQLGQRLEAMCNFANGKTPEQFMHPVVRAIILHFWLAYDHPFVDGNGRAARALFYWCLLRYGYWLAEFISISAVISKAKTKYYRAFLYCETDDNDLTYFVLYHLEVIRQAIKDVHRYVERKTAELQAVERYVRGTVGLNHRQRALIAHALRHPEGEYSIESHRRSHNVVYQTARTDLLNLAERGLLSEAKVGRTWYFRPVPDLEKRLQELE